MRGGLADPTGGRPLGPAVDDAAEKRPRRHDDRPGAQDGPVHLDADHAAALDDQRAHLGLGDPQARRVGERVHHRGPVLRAVDLRARTLDGRALAPVQHAKMNAGRVGAARHQPAKRVDLTDELPLAEAADRRIAR